MHIKLLVFICVIFLISILYWGTLFGDKKSSEQNRLFFASGDHSLRNSLACHNNNKHPWSYFYNHTFSFCLEILPLECCLFFVLQQTFAIRNQNHFQPRKNKSKQFTVYKLAKSWVDVMLNMDSFQVTTVDKKRLRYKSKKAYLYRLLWNIVVLMPTGKKWKVRHSVIGLLMYICSLQRS